MFDDRIEQAIEQAGDPWRAHQALALLRSPLPDAAQRKALRDASLQFDLVPPASFNATHKMTPNAKQLSPAKANRVRRQFQREVEVAEQNRQRAVAIEIEKVTRARDLEIVSREREVELQKIEAEKAVEVEKKEIANVIRERVVVDKTVAIEEERIKEVREVSEADRAKQVQVLAAEAEADEAKVKQVKAAEAEELSAKFKASEITTMAQANLEASAKEADAKRPERQMLANIFAPILKDLGQLNTQKATILSGPTEVKMRRDKQPAKQWVIGLGQAKFKVTIGKKCGKKWTVRDAMKMTEEIPVAYRRCLEIVSEDDKDGLAFYKGLGGAHGSQDYMNVEPGARSRVIIHEGGHCFDQRARNSEPDIMKRWESAIKEDNIDVSGYGNSVSHEDLAEFARIYGYCTDYAVGKGMKWELKKLSPKRFELWEHILRKCKALPLLHLDVEFNPLGVSLHEGKGNTDGAKVEFISGPTKVEWKQYSRSQNKMVTIKGKQWLAKLGDTQFKITFEDVEMQLKREDAVKLVETLPPAYRASLVATSEEGETGLTIYKDGCAYGVPNQIAMGGHNLSATTLAH